MWTEVYIPFAEMVPLYRGFVVNQAGPLSRFLLFPEPLVMERRVFPGFNQPQ